MNRGRRGAGAPSLLTALLACVLGASGCVRFGYHGSEGTGGHSGSGHGGRGGAGAGGGDDSDGGSLTVDDAATYGGDAEVVHGDGAVDGSVSLYCPEHPEWLFCSGFETNDVGRWGYQLGKVEVTGAVKRSGTQAMSAYTGPDAENRARWAAENVLHDQMSGDIWMRSWNYMPGSVKIDEHFSLSIISDANKPFDGFELRVLPTGTAINYSINGTEHVTKTHLTLFPPDTWVCVELHVKIDATAGVYEAFVDGDQVAQASPVDTLPAQGFGVAEVGIHFAGPNQGPVQVYVDDVVIAHSRIFCD